MSELCMPLFVALFCCIYILGQRHFKVKREQFNFESFFVVVAAGRLRF